VNGVVNGEWSMVNGEDVNSEWGNGEEVNNE
jgi:hypothetical protein